MKAVQFNEYGGPDVLKYMNVKKPLVGVNDVLIEVKAIGVNYADTARREGRYVVPTELPFIPGLEVAGVVVEVGKSVKSVRKGMRVVTLIESGGYAEYVAVASKTLVPIPNDISFEEAAALLVQGQSAYHILKTMGQLKKGETVLIHAASGGVGLLAVQLAKIFGAGRVIATASTPEKLSLAKEMGADYLVNYSEDGWEKEVLELTNGAGVDVALEMVGGRVFYNTLKCLSNLGRLVIYGVASGEQAKFHPSSLMKGNQAVIGFFLPEIVKVPDLFESSLEELLEYVGQGRLKLTIDATYSLSEAVQVHQLFQDRKTKGKIVLIP